MEIGRRNMDYATLWYALLHLENLSSKSIWRRNWYALHLLFWGPSKHIYCFFIYERPPSQYSSVCCGLFIRPSHAGQLYLFRIQTQVIEWMVQLIMTAHALSFSSYALLVLWCVIYIYIYIYQQNSILDVCFYRSSWIYESVRVGPCFIFLWIIFYAKYCLVRVGGIDPPYRSVD